MGAEARWGSFLNWELILLTIIAIATSVGAILAIHQRITDNPHLRIRRAMTRGQAIREPGGEWLAQIAVQVVNAGSRDAHHCLAVFKVVDGPDGPLADSAWADARERLQLLTEGPTRPDGLYRPFDLRAHSPIALVSFIDGGKVSLGPSGRGVLHVSVQLAGRTISRRFAFEVNSKAEQQSGVTITPLQKGRTKPNAEH